MTGTVSAAAVLERIACANSSTVYIYDLAELVGFGKETKERHAAGESVANVVSLQTRAGAGLKIVGNLSDVGSSSEWTSKCVLTAYTTPEGLAAMAQSLSYLSSATAANRLVVQVPAISPIRPTLQFSPSLASISTLLSTLPDSFSIILTSRPRETVDIGRLIYDVTDSHVIHVFDYFGVSRELGDPLSTPTEEHHATLSFEEAMKTAKYSYFEYEGDTAASDVVVLLNGAFSSAVRYAVRDLTGIGILSVRVLRPWDEQKFISRLPTSAKVIHVVDEVPTKGVPGLLYAEVFATFLSSGSIRPSIRKVVLTPLTLLRYINSPQQCSAFLEALSPSIERQSAHEVALVKRAMFFSTPSSPLANLPSAIRSVFTPVSNIRIQMLQEEDALSKPGGVVCGRLTFLQKDVEFSPLNSLVPYIQSDDSDSEAAGSVDLLVVADLNLLKTHSIAHYLKPESSLLLLTASTASEIAVTLPHDVLSVVLERDIKLYRMDWHAVAEGHGDATHVDRLSLVAAQLAFLRLYLGPKGTEATLRQFSRTIFSADNGLDTVKLNARTWASLETIDLTQVSEVDRAPEESAPALKQFAFNTVLGSRPSLRDEQPSLPGAYVSTWHTAARHLLFRDAYEPLIEHGDVEATEEFPEDPSLRPEIPDRTFLVTCSVNRRLTPLDYDRNVFHLEFDTKGAGLKYAIGEALGVHGWNDTEEVLDFCRWYGVDPDRLITLPVPSSEGKFHTRTIFQSLQQQIDIFGHPPKSFYAELSNYASRREDKMTLYFIGSSEGSSTYKKLSEKDTVTFADVLLQYKSARPPIEKLCELIGDIKPRHYSIASAQSVVGDRVDLLVVTVEWATPTGSPRFGQCTRYLAGLKVGQKVTVSIKPSVMKLPPDNMQPLILAGLGTGAAPFRAFLQHRAHLASRGTPVGPLYYYFGSRYRAKEYLYGEEVEAFILDKTITRAGLAFSRDSKKKVYIQHLMTQDSQDLVRMLHKENGVFYLCGPTWPVPDVYETLVAALGKYNGLGATEAGEYLEGLKEEERYVLEVY